MDNINYFIYGGSKFTSMEETLSNSDNISIDESDGNKLLRKRINGNEAE